MEERIITRPDGVQLYAQCFAARSDVQQRGVVVMVHGGSGWYSGPFTPLAKRLSAEGGPDFVCACKCVPVVVVEMLSHGEHR